MQKLFTTVPGSFGFAMRKILYPVLFCLLAGVPHWLAAQTIIEIDNADAVFEGIWTTASSSPDRYQKDYKFKSTADGSGEAGTATYTPDIKTTGKYSIDIYFAHGSNRATNAPWIITCESGTETVLVNQQINGGKWVRIASDKLFKAGTSATIRLSNNSGTAGAVVVADGVRLVPEGVSAAAIPIPDSSTPKTGSPTAANSGGGTSDRKNFSLNVSASNGTVQKTPEEVSYEPGKMVKLTATANSGYVFAGWAGDIGSSQKSYKNPLSLKMDGQKNITAQFAPIGLGVIMDNQDPGVEFKGGWTLTPLKWPGKRYEDYRMINVRQNPDALAIFRPDLPKAGRYDVYVWHSQGGNRTTAAPWMLHHKGGQIPAIVNQQMTGGEWTSIATNIVMVAGRQPDQYLQLSNNTTDYDQAGRIVVADAVAFVFIGD